MTNQISNLLNLSGFAALGWFAISANLSSCHLSRLAWLFTQEAFSLLTRAALTIWHTSQPQTFAAHHVAGCPVAALHLLQAALHAVAAVL